MAIIKGGGGVSRIQRGDEDERKKKLKIAQQRTGSVPAAGPLRKPREEKPPQLRAMDFTKIGTPPDSSMATKGELGKDDPLPTNISNLAKAAKLNGVDLSAEQVYQLLSVAGREYSTEQWHRIIQPLSGRNPFIANMNQIIKQHYNDTGMLPDPDSLRRMIQEAQGVLDKREVTKGKPLTLVEALANGANAAKAAAHRKATDGADKDKDAAGRTGRWTLKDIERWGSEKKADYMRQLANRPQYTLGRTWKPEKGKDVLTDRDRELIDTARQWYMGTDLKKRIIARQEASTGRFDPTRPDMTDNSAAIKLIANMYGEKSDSYKNLNTFANLRRTSYEKDKLPKNRQTIVDIFGRNLEEIYQAKLTKDDKGHYKWDENFDKYASTYLVESSIFEAIATNPYDEKKNPNKYRKIENDRKAAMANISLATYGQIKTDDDLREYFQRVGFLPKNKDDYSSLPERFSKYLFGCYVNTRRPYGEPIEFTIANYVKDFAGGNLNYLPQELRVQYLPIIEAVGPMLLEYQQTEVDIRNPLKLLFENQVAIMKDARTIEMGRQKPEFGVDQGEYPEWIMTQNGVPYQVEGGKVWTPEMRRHAQVQESRRGAEVSPAVTSAAGPRPGTKLYSGKPLEGIDPNDDFQMWWAFTGSPLAHFVADKAKEIGIKTMGAPAWAWNYFQITMAMIAVNSGKPWTAMHGQASSEGGDDPGYDAWKGVLKEYSGEGGKWNSFKMMLTSANPLNLRVLDDPRDYFAYNTIEAVKNAWNEMRESEDPTSEWIRFQLAEDGVDLDKHGGLIFWSALMNEIPIDILADKGVTSVARFGLKGAAKVLARMSSEKLVARVAAAEIAMRAKSAAGMLRAAEEAEKVGNTALASTLREMAPTLAEQDLRSGQLLEGLGGKVAEARGKVPVGGVSPRRMGGYTRKFSRMTQDEILADMSLMNRPLWYDTFAHGLAQAPLEGQAVARILGVRMSHIPEGAQRYVRTTLAAIGASKDADDIIIMMNRIAAIGAVELDPGKLMIGKARHIRAMMRGLPSFDAFGTVIHSERRLSGALVDAEQELMDVATQTRWGLQKGEEKAAASRLWEYIKRLEEVSNETSLSVAERDLKRRIIWDEAMMEIRDNVKRLPFDEGLYESIVKYAKRNGMDVTEFVADYRAGKLTSLDLFDAMRKVKAGKAHGKTLARGGNKASYYGPFQSDRPMLVKTSKSAGQGAQDLLLPFDMRDMASFMNGAAKWQLWSHSRVGVGAIGFLPSFASVSDVGRTLATAVMTLPFTALFIDEFWRPLVAGIRGEIKLGRNIPEVVAANRDFMRLVTPDAFESMVHQSAEFIPINALDTPGAYAAFVNRFTKALQKDPFGERFLQWEKELAERLAADGDDIANYNSKQLAEMFKQHMYDFIVDPENAEVRQALEATGRGFKGGWRNPVEYEEQLAEHTSALRAMEESHAGIQAELETVRADLRHLLDEPTWTAKTRQVRVPAALPPQTKGAINKRLGEWADHPNVKPKWDRFHARPTEQNYRILRNAVKKELETQLKADLDAPLPKGSKISYAERNKALRADYKAKVDKIDKYMPKFKMVTVHEEYGNKLIKLRNLLSSRYPMNIEWIKNWLVEHNLSDIVTHKKPNLFVSNFKTKREMVGAMRAAGLNNETIRQMANDYLSERLALYGIDLNSPELADYVRLTARRKELAAEERRLWKEMFEHRKNQPLPNRMNNDMEEYIDKMSEFLANYRTTPDLWDAFASGKKLSKSDIVAKNKAGIELPPIAGARGHGRSPWIFPDGQRGWVPILSGYAELLPYRVMNHMGDWSRRAMFHGRFNYEFERLMSRGYAFEDALKAAQHRAKDYSAKSMYTAGNTFLEEQLGKAFYFLPAYRQAAIYWAHEFARNPVVYSRLIQKFRADHPMAYLGDYGTYIPLPLFIGQGVTDMVQPGLSLPFILPMRFANYLSGWETKEEKLPDGSTKHRYVYTGKTSLDWLSENRILNPLTGFSSKNTSPVTIFDDFLWGVAGEASYPWLDTDHFALAAAAAVGLAMRKDPVIRTKQTMNILRGQMAHGQDPDASVYEKRFRGSPWWYEAMVHYAKIKNPDAILSLITRAGTPRAVKYSPSDVDLMTSEYSNIRLDVSASPSVKKTAWDTIGLFDDEDARTVAGAEAMYYEAMNDPAKQRRILDKYPILEEIQRYRSLDAYDREQYLMNEKNRWIIPYVTSKYDYDSDTGTPLTIQEYDEQMTSGAAMVKSIDDWMANNQRLLDNAKWSVVYNKIEKDSEKEKKLAIKEAKRLINKYESNQRQRESMLRSLDGYAKRYWGFTPSGEYDSKDISRPAWLIDFAYREYGPKYEDNRLKWDVAYVEKKRVALMKLEGTRTGEFVGQRPLSKTEKGKPGVEYKGVLDYYTNNALLRGDYEAGVGMATRINDAFDAYLANPADLPFNLRHSMSFKSIQEERDKHRDRMMKDVADVLTTPYYYQEPDKLAKVIPMIFNPKYGYGTKEELASWLTRQNHLHSEFTEVYGSDYFPKAWGKDYEAAKKKFDAELKKMFSEKIATPFRDGTAGIILMSLLVDPGEGRAVSKRYVDGVVSALVSKNEPDYTKLVHDFKYSGWKRGDKAAAAHAWASVCTAAIAMGKAGQQAAEGKKTETRAKLANRLDKYVRAWLDESESFSNQWGKMGGMSLITELFKRPL